MEIWKKIPFAKDYEASNRGRIRKTNSIRRNNVLSGTIGSRGYRQHGFLVDKKVSVFNTHRIIAELFVDNPHNYRFVNHKDGNKLNPDSNNLEWVTAKQNMSHAVKNGLFDYKKITNCNRKLREGDIREIRDLRKNGMLLKDIAKKYNVHLSNISDIVNNKLWEWVL